MTRCGRSCSTGSPHIASRPDLLSRAIVLELPVLAEESTQPESSSTSGSTRRGRGSSARSSTSRPRCSRSCPRSSSSARLEWPTSRASGSRSSRRLDWPEGSFLAAYRGQQAEAFEAALDADPLARCPLKFMELDAQLDGWSGTATELLAKLTNLADDEVMRRRNWPASAAVLGKRLKELVPALRPTGLEIEKAGSGRGTSKQRRLGSSGPLGMGTAGTVGTAMRESAANCARPGPMIFWGDLDAEAQDLPHENRATTGAPHPCLLKPSEVAVRLGVSRSWVYAAAADGRLPSHPPRRPRRPAALRRARTWTPGWSSAGRAGRQGDTERQAAAEAADGPRLHLLAEEEERGPDLLHQVPHRRRHPGKEGGRPHRGEAERALNAALAAVDRGEQRPRAARPSPRPPTGGWRARSRGSRPRPIAATRSICACG